MPRSLSDAPERLVLDFIVSKWDATNAVGYDPSASLGDESLLLADTRLDNVRAQYPSLVCTFSNETTPGESTYDFMSTSGAGQTRNGTVLVTVRAADRPGDDYSGNSATYDAVDAEELVDTIADEALRVALDNPRGGNTDLHLLGGQPGPDAPDDTDVNPTVRIAQRQIDFSWLREP